MLVPFLKKKEPAGQLEFSDSMGESSLSRQFDPTYATALPARTRAVLG